MSHKCKKVAVLTSGGDAPGMNAAVRAVVRSGLSAGFEMFAVYHGYEGLLENDIRPISSLEVGDVLQRGGTILRTARCTRFHEDNWIKLAAENLRSHDIEHLVVIGGDGSFHGALRLSRFGINVVGIPATIDRDLAYTENTIGFDTAINTILELISKIRDTSSSHERTTVIEVMGRDSGHIAIAAALGGGADAVLVPEISTDIDNVVQRIRSGQSSGKCHSIIITAEGSDIPTSELCRLISEKTDKEVKAVIPGYIQRGGSPSAADRIIAGRFGNAAIDIIADNNKLSPNESFCIAVGLKHGEICCSDMEAALAEESVFEQDLYELCMKLS